MISTAIILGIVTGLLPILFAIYTSPYTVAFHERTQKVADPFTQGLGRAFLYAPWLLAGAGFVSLIVTAVYLASPHLTTFITAGFFIVPILLIAAVGLFLLSLVANPDEERRGQQMGLVIAAVVTTAVVLAGSVWRHQQAMQAALPPAPFQYVAGSVEVLTPQGNAVQETPLYCPGDQLVIRFDGVSDGSGRVINIWGELLQVVSGPNESEQLEPVKVDGGRYQRETFPSEPAPPSDAEGVIFDQYVIPADLPPGTYVWKHSNTSGGTWDNRTVASQEAVVITGRFQVLPCD